MFIPSIYIYFPSESFKNRWDGMKLDASINQIPDISFISDYEMIFSLGPSRKILRKPSIKRWVLLQQCYGIFCAELPVNLSSRGRRGLRVEGTSLVVPAAAVAKGVGRKYPQNPNKLGSKVAFCHTRVLMSFNGWPLVFATLQEHIDDFSKTKTF